MPTIELTFGLCNKLKLLKLHYKLNCIISKITRDQNLIRIRVQFSIVNDVKLKGFPLTVCSARICITTPYPSLLNVHLCLSPFLAAMTQPFVAVHVGKSKQSLQ